MPAAPPQPPGSQAEPGGKSTGGKSTGGTSPGGGAGAGKNRGAAGPEAYGKYRPIKKLGAGGMGVVYLAEDTELGRKVALKTLPKTANTPPNLLARFRSEARAAAKLHHPGIVQVFDTGETDDALYIALEFVDGKDVDALLKTRERLPPKRAADLVRQVAEALEHLHERGVVHRDVKPSNIMVRRDGSAVLTDLGLARAAEEDADGGITRAGYTVGTVDYMSPEQARSSRTADVRSDLYSLGCAWFHMLTGRIPFPGDSLTAKLAAHAKQPVPDPRRVHDDIPASFTAVLHRALAKNPDERYQTPAEFLDDLRAAMRNRGSVSEDLLRDLAADEPEGEPAGEPEGEPGQAAAEEPAGAAGEAPSGRRRRRRFGRRAKPAAETAEIAAPGAGAAADDGGSGADIAGALAREERRAADRRRAEAADLADSDPAAPAARRGERGSGSAAVKAAPPAKPRRRGRRRDGEVPAAGAQPADGAQPKVKKAGGKGLDPLLVRNLAVAGLAAGLILGLGFVAFRFADALGGGAAVVATRNAADDDTADRPAADPEQEETFAPTVVRDAAPRRAAPPADPAAPPDWAADLPDAADGRGVEVTDPDGLAAALAGLPKSGGTVTLVGDGPFVLTPVSLPAGADVTLAAADGRRPVVALAPPAGDGRPDGRDDAPAGWLTVAGGSLTLSGVHLFLPESGGEGGDARPPVVAAEGATVAVRGGSVTAAGGPATLVRAAPGAARGRRPAAPARVLLEGVALRGEDLTAVALPAGPAEVFAAGTLFATGRGPVARFGGGAGAAAAVAGGPFRFVTSRNRDEPARAVRLVNCGGAFAGAAFVLAPGVRGAVRVTVAGGALGAAPGLGAGDVSARLVSNPGGAEVDWAFPDATLLGLDAPETADPAPATAGPDGWPGEPLAAFAAADPERFRPDGLDRKAADWAVPGGRTLARAAALAAAPRPPVAWGDRFPDGVTIETGVDDAADVLARSHPDGATVVLRGGGRVVLDPLTVAGRNLRILGEPGRDGDAADPPVLIPKTGLGGTAFLSAVGGRLELDNVAVEARRDPTGAGPLLRADGREAAVVVRRARLEAGGEAPAVAARGGGAAFLSRTLLVGPGGDAALVDAGDGGVRADRCAFVTPGAVLTVGGGTNGGGTALLDRCTLAAGGPLFGGEGNGGGVVLTRRCLFGPAPPRSPGETALVADGGFPAVWGDGDAFGSNVRELPAANPGELRGARTGPAAVVLDRPNVPAWNRVAGGDLVPAAGSPAARDGLGAGGEVGPEPGRGAGPAESPGGGRPNRPAGGPNF